MLNILDSVGLVGKVEDVKVELQISL